MAAAGLEANAASPVGYNKRWLRSVPVHVVTVDLNDPNISVSPAMARHGVGTSEGFGSMLSRLRPAAAITGTFFCVKRLFPVGDIVVDDRLVYAGSVGTGVCFTPDNSVVFKPLRGRSKTDWSGYPNVICTGPRLLTDSKVTLYPRGEGFRDRALYRKAHRSALGVTKHKKLLLVTVNRPIYLSKLAHIMRELGAVDAVNLDGGSSTALHYQGKTFSHPNRRLTNLIVIYANQDRFAKIKPQLAPTPIVASKDSRS